VLVVTWCRSGTILVSELFCGKSINLQYQYQNTGCPSILWTVQHRSLLQHGWPFRISSHTYCRLALQLFIAIRQELYSFTVLCKAPIQCLPLLGLLSQETLVWTMCLLTCACHWGSRNSNGGRSVFRKHQSTRTVSHKGLCRVSS
jgi:hypothetical protein